MTTTSSWWRLLLTALLRWFCVIHQLTCYSVLCLLCHCCVMLSVGCVINSKTVRDSSLFTHLQETKFFSGLNKYRTRFKFSGIAKKHICSVKRLCQNGWFYSDHHLVPREYLTFYVAHRLTFGARPFRFAPEVSRSEHHQLGLVGHSVAASQFAN